MVTPWEIASRLDDRGGLTRVAVRGLIGAVKSAKDTAQTRRLTTVRWSSSRGEWLHRWPEGRVSDRRRWGTLSKWATNGTDYDMFDLLWRHYRPQPGDTVIDVGAGHGGETFFLADMVGPTGKVLAIEAAPKPYARLVELIGANGWSQVEALQVAVSSEAGEVVISDEDDWVEGNVYSDKGAPVRAMTLDDLCAERGITQVDWMKMNIEGAEKDAVRGMERMAPYVRHMTISCHDFLGTEWGRSKDVVVEWLTEHGFHVQERGGNGPDWEQSYIYASRA